MSLIYNAIGDDKCKSVCVRHSDIVKLLEVELGNINDRIRECNHIRAQCKATVASCNGMLVRSANHFVAVGVTVSQAMNGYDDMKEEIERLSSEYNYIELLRDVATRHNIQ